MTALRTVVRGTGEVLITLGLLVLLFLLWQLWWTDVVAGRSQGQLADRVSRSWTAQQPTGSPPSAVQPSAVQPGAVQPGTVQDPKLTLRNGEAFALIRIPRFGKNYVRPVVQGVSLDVLDRGVGHYPTSADPGAIGNFALAGHRVTYAKPFNRIDELKKGDPIVIETARAWFVYRVVGYTIVTPDRVDVIAPVPQRPGQQPTKRMMTMTACHPKYSARQRYVLFSELDERIAKAPGVLPAVLK